MLLMKDIIDDSNKLIRSISKEVSLPLSKEDHDLLSAVGQMSLCFAEVVIFAILSIISKYIGEDIFYLIFLLSIISTAVINFQIIKEEKD